MCVYLSVNISLQIIDSKPPQPSQKTGKTAVVNSHKPVTRHHELENKPIRNTSTLLNPPALTQSTSVKQDSVVRVGLVPPEDAVSESAVDMDEPSFCVRARQRENVRTLYIHRYTHSEIQLFEYPSCKYIC